VLYYLYESKSSKVEWMTNEELMVVKI